MCRWEGGIWVFGAIGCSIEVLLHVVSLIRSLTKHSVQLKLLVWKHISWFPKAKVEVAGILLLPHIITQKPSPHLRRSSTHERWDKLLVAISGDDLPHLFCEIRMQASNNVGIE